SDARALRCRLLPRNEMQPAPVARLSQPPRLYARALPDARHRRDGRSRRDQARLLEQPRAQPDRHRAPWARRQFHRAPRPRAALGEGGGVTERFATNTRRSRSKRDCAWRVEVNFAAVAGRNEPRRARRSRSNFFARLRRAILFLSVLSAPSVSSVV